jgi:hypothetical protein
LNASFKAFALVFFGFSLLFVFAIASGNDSGQHLLDMLITAALLVSGLAFIAYAFSARLTISDDLIEYRTLFFRRCCRPDQVSHRREYEELRDEVKTGYLELVPKDLSLPSLTIPSQISRSTTSSTSGPTTSPIATV